MLFTTVLVIGGPTNKLHVPEYTITSERRVCGVDGASYANTPTCVGGTVVGSTVTSAGNTSVTLCARPALLPITKPPGNARPAVKVLVVSRFCTASTRHEMTFGVASRVSINVTSLFAPLVSSTK